MSGEFWRTEITNEAAALLEHVPENLDITAAEVGVLRAKTACIMLYRRPQLNLILVDSWHESSEGPTGEIVYQEAMRNLAPFQDRVLVLRTDSTIGAEAAEDDSLEYVLIDGDHRYPKCLIDMLAWWPKIREAGILFHHDIDHPDFPHWGVRRACADFCRITMTDFYVNEDRGMAMIRKPILAMGDR